MKKNLYKIIFFFVLALAALSAGFFLDMKGNIPGEQEREARIRIESNLHSLEGQAISLMDDLLEYAKGSKQDYHLFLQKLKSRDDISTSIKFAVSDSSGFVFWTSKSITYSQLQEAHAGFLTLPNGYYEYFRKQTGNKVCHTLILIKNNFTFENEYLKNVFNPSLKVSGDIGLSPDSSSGQIIRNQWGKALFSIKSTVDAENPYTSLIRFFYILFLAAAALSLHYTIKSYRNKSPKWPLFLLLALVGIRSVFLSIHRPEEIFNLPLFQPQYYASGFLNGSLGDLLINSFIGLYIVHFLWKNRKTLFGNAAKLQRHQRYFLFFVISLVFFTLTLLSHSVFSGLIENSKIPFNLNNILEMNLFSFAGFTAIGFLFVSIYFLGILYTYLAFLLIKEGGKKTVLLFISCLSLGFTELIFYTDIKGGPDYLIFIVTLLLTLTYIWRKKEAIIPISRVFVIILVFSVYAAYVIYSGSGQKELENRLILAGKLDKDQDRLAEYIFREGEKEFEKDTLTGFLYQKGEINLLSQHLRDIFLKGYLKRFDSKIYVFDSKGHILKRSPNTDTIIYFENLIHYQGTPTSSPLLYFLNNTSKLSYLAKIPLKSGTNINMGTAYMELNAELKEENAGLPELLVTGPSAFIGAFSQYSTAVYENNLLTSHTGEYNYNITSEDYPKHVADYLVFNSGGYTHLIYNANENRTILISKRAGSWLDFITLFSYIFTFLCLCAFLVWVNSRYGKNRTEFNLATRIQVVILVVLLISVSSIGGGTIYYIINKYEARKNAQILERIQLLNNIVSQNFQPGDISHNIRYLRNTHAAFIADFNIYDLKGNLIYTTQPRVLEQGLTSSKIQYEALYQIKTLRKASSIQNEKIGGLEFLSAYVPVFSQNNKMEAILNLPYFSKQTELKKEISNFLLTLINVYVLLISLSIVIALFVANRIAKPLKLVQRQMAALKLGKRNEPIEWHLKDEIGLLVEQYNKMTEELARSAEALAKSEREEAWREMARQVAHEIKNPLTPMKLSVQHLMRAAKERPEQISSLIEKTSRVLVEQIDSLSSIASAFSDFAKMPGAKNENINLYEVVLHCYELFRETENVKISFENRIGNNQLTVLGDKEQLQRVFTNIIKNAVQVLEGNKEGFVAIEISENQHRYIVSIKDNGPGIPLNEHEKVFQPYFTTKSGGTGLGLAMSEKIITALGGEIWFESEEGRGATFYVSLLRVG